VKHRAGPWILIAIGAIFLMHNLGVVSFEQIRPILAKWWPAILIAVGVIGLVTSRRGRD